MAVEAAAERPRGAAVRPIEAYETGGGGLFEANAAVVKARQSGDPADIAAAITELQAVGIGLPPGSPLRAVVLIPLAGMQALLAVRTTYPLALADAVDAAIEAVRVAARLRA